MKQLFRLMAMAAIAPALAGCAVADLAAHAVKEYDKSRTPRSAEVQPAAAQPATRPPLQPAVARPAADADGPVTLSAEPAPARESVRVETLK